MIFFYRLQNSVFSFLDLNRIFLSFQRKCFEDDRAMWLKHQFLNTTFADQMKPQSRRTDELSKRKFMFLLVYFLFKIKLEICFLILQTLVMKRNSFQFLVKSANLIFSLTTPMELRADEPTFSSNTRRKTTRANPDEFECE